MDPEIGRHWWQERNDYLERSDESASVLPAPETPALMDLLKSLPGERGTGFWKFATIMNQPGARNDVPEGLVVPFKRAVLELFRDHYWPVFSGRGLELPDGSRQRFIRFELEHHQETGSSPIVGDSEPVSPRRNRDR